MTRLLASLAVILACAPAWADDWPQWRGPRRDGVAPNAQLPKVWPKTFPAPVWKATVGEGQASPAIAGGRAVIRGRVKDDREVGYCFDAVTGKPLWSYGYHAPYEPPDKRAGPGPKSTPLIDGPRVYMLGAAGMFHCFEAATGNIVWK